jgi:hypothetical protein
MIDKVGGGACVRSGSSRSRRLARGIPRASADERRESRRPPSRDRSRTREPPSRRPPSRRAGATLTRACLSLAGRLGRLSVTKEGGVE